MTIDEAHGLLITLTAAFPRFELPVPTAELYFRHLEPLPFERTKIALDRLVMTDRFFPSIAEMLEAVGVDDDASRTQLLLAMAGRLALVRDAASATGWAVGRALLPPAALPPPAPSGPAGPLVSAERQKSLRERVTALGSGMRGDREVGTW